MKRILRVKELSISSFILTSQDEFCFFLPLTQERVKFMMTTSV